jgi:hypothetical protein
VIRHASPLDDLNRTRVATWLPSRIFSSSSHSCRVIFQVVTHVVGVRFGTTTLWEQQA